MYGIVDMKSRSEALEVIDIAPSCLKVTREGPQQTMDGKRNIERSTEHDRACHAAETAEQKNIDRVSPGQTVDQGVLLVQLLRLSCVATPR